LDVLTELKESVAGRVSETLSDIGAEVTPDQVEVSLRTTPSHGDLSTAVCFKAASILSTSPHDLANRIASGMEKPELIAEVRATNGYLNFFVDWQSFSRRVIDQILREGAAYGRAGRRRGVLVLEHTSVNPTGPLNIARSRNSIIGDSLARIFAYQGWDVHRCYLLNDVGHQVVTILWGRRKGLFSKELENTYQKYASKKDFKVFFTYVPAVARTRDDPEAQRELSELESKVHRDMDLLDELTEISKECLEGQLETLSRLGIEFDEITPESQFIRDGSLEAVLSRLRETGVLVENPEGSVGIDLSRLGLKRRKSEFVTLVKADGSSTYTLRDIAYHEWKFKRGDRFITVLGEDHKREFTELKAALRLLGHQEDLRAAFYSFVTYQGGKKMSTRTGKTVPLDEVIDEAIARSREEVLKRRQDLAEADVERIAVQVGLGAIKFNILRIDPNKGIKFSWDEAIDFTGDSSAYVQYARARASSILRKAGGYTPGDATSLDTPEEKELIWSLALTPTVIARSATDMKPNYLTDHAIQVSSLFNRFYMKHRVIQAQEPVRSARLSLTQAVRDVLTTLLGLLGVEAPDEI